MQGVLLLSIKVRGLVRSQARNAVECRAVLSDATSPKSEPRGLLSSTRRRWGCVADYERKAGHQARRRQPA